MRRFRGLRFRVFWQRKKRSRGGKWKSGGVQAIGYDSRRVGSNGRSDKEQCCTCPDKDRYFEQRTKAAWSDCPKKGNISIEREYIADFKHFKIYQCGFCHVPSRILSPDKRRESCVT
ncbi:hypothetical protein AKJ16_DCAP04979 [Drosera capensis]